MKTLRAINFQIIPLDNDGYLVHAEVDKKVENLTESPQDLAYTMFGKTHKEVEPMRFYCPDSTRVGEAITDIVNKANLENVKTI